MFNQSLGYVFDFWEFAPFSYSLKGQKKSNWFLQGDISSKNRTNGFYFTTMKPQFDLFSFVFWRKLKTPKRHFKIIWPLAAPIIIIYCNFAATMGCCYCLWQIPKWNMDNSLLWQPDQSKVGFIYNLWISLSSIRSNQEWLL